MSDFLDLLKTEMEKQSKKKEESDSVTKLFSYIWLTILTGSAVAGLVAFFMWVF